MNRYARRLAAVLIVAAATSLPAQDYPKGAISMVIPLAPGDANDIVGRSVADDLSRELKVPVLPVNRPGGRRRAGDRSRRKGEE
jgi:tripartite-type tricarboxylate transporter receptor subunit TctC